MDQQKATRDDASLADNGEQRESDLERTNKVDRCLDGITARIQVMSEELNDVRKKMIGESEPVDAGKKKKMVVFEKFIWILVYMWKLWEDVVGRTTDKLYAPQMFGFVLILAICMLFPTILYIVAISVCITSGLAIMELLCQ